MWITFNNIPSKNLYDFFSNLAILYAVKLISYMTLFSILCWNLHAVESYPTYHFNIKKYPLSQQRYQRYARPQLKNMTKEFYYILKNFSPTLKEIINSREDFLRHVNFLQEISFLSLDNPAEVKRIFIAYDYLIKINRSLMYLKLQIAKELNTFKTSEDYIAHFPELLTKLISLEDHLYQLINKLKNSIDISQQELVQIKQITFLIYHKFNYLMIDTLPGQLKVEFERVWFYFFRPLEKYILPAQSPHPFLERVEDLNMVWNTFHMKISKGEMRVPVNGHKIIITMHQRWVSILKLFLKR